MDKKAIELIKEALIEDGVDNDITTLNLVSKDKMLTGSFIVKATGVVSGIDVAKEVFKQINPRIKMEILKANGTFVNRGDVIATIEGPMRDILRGERVALNFLQRMSGIAATTAKFVQELAGTNCKILDTRKTAPLLRVFERQAVRDGGGENHRFNLSDRVLIKDNHIAASGSIQDAVSILRKAVGRGMIIEVEVETLDEFMEALNTSADVIMLDNMSNEVMKKCVELNEGKKKLEASGNMELKKVRSVALLGVDYISVGSLTHSYKALDISLKFRKSNFR
ncbi:MAG: carboxylating nicotinate-nucleotide diphosphorylase [Acholeplasmatales bacterium]|jgi:nicotinate-nucleotide diphosphorylase (carboxylating)|nr:carboxylating nicotinate-nucleotide diphosphorylase [Acholeplasmatales bacterium]MDD7394599.1 carboxylating nicotinate-nucleotide diphosphorylase [Acholeplasmatales bacterium]CDD21889.1 nicotinate-nucleotide pyrophosphorylase [Firmicutes bacterium CAG:313]HCX08215.1 carboxylating nicotinate-nucleotide diphosphorylase [Acholeplasmatales bacterium]